MNWLELYKPKLLSDIKHNENEIKKCIKWIEDYKKDSASTKKVLFICGPIGCGKTLLGEVLLKSYNYQKIELNSSDLRSQKKIGEFLKKALTYENILDMFNNKKNPIGVLMDEIDTICKLSDKGGFNEFLNILKLNDKHASILTKNNDSKKKVKKVKISIDDYIKLYNPIICTSNDINDKKINELKKFSEVITLRKPTTEEMINIIDEIYNKYKQKIEKDVKLKICNNVLYDIRRLIILLEDLYIYAKGEKITNVMYEEYKKIFTEKQEDLQLIESTKILLTKKVTFNDSLKYFDIDCLLTPLMIYHNSIDYIKNCEDNSSKKLEVYKNVMASLCLQDTIQTNIFEQQDWDELYEVSSFYGAYVPNFFFGTLKNKKSTNVDIEFTSLLNKISQMFVNKKLLNSAKYSLGKINFDNDELIYLTEIISMYFDNYKLSDDSSEDLSDDSEYDSEDENYNIPSQNDSELIKFMNKYYMSIDDLENILKIEKLNQNNEKKKKKFTLKIKKNISKYLLNKD
jgi:SpoVK/Ycf46/Vps4 family AAA+-type ATPase